MYVLLRETERPLEMDTSVTAWLVDAGSAFVS
jgi:hypothetical protein